MQLKTLLNSVEKHKGFVYEWIKLVLVGTQKQLHIKMRPAKRCQGLCSVCLTAEPTYDTLDERRFQFVPLWGIVVFFLYAMRRISCATCKAVIVDFFTRMVKASAEQRESDGAMLVFFTLGIGHMYKEVHQIGSSYNMLVGHQCENLKFSTYLEYEEKCGPGP